MPEEAEKKPENGKLPNIDEVRNALRNVVDPEIHIDIVSLGLVYDVKVEGNDVHIKMTLTSPGCPYGPILIQQAQEVLKNVEGVKGGTIEVVWDPPWDPRTMASDEVKMMLGLI